MNRRVGSALMMTAALTLGACGKNHEIPGERMTFLNVDCRELVQDVAPASRLKEVVTPPEALAHRYIGFAIKSVIQFCDNNVAKANSYKINLPASSIGVSCNWIELTGSYCSVDNGSPVNGLHK